LFTVDIARIYAVKKDHEVTEYCL